MFELGHAFDLVIGDDPSSNSIEESLTYNHAVYGKRQIDFMLFSRKIIIDECHASNLIDLGSDHRSVPGKIHLPRRQKRWSKLKLKRGWRPNDEFITELDSKLDQFPDLTLESLSMLLSHCAASCSKPSNDVSSTKPWKDPDVKRLVSERRTCRDSGRRLELSKAIMKAVRIAKRRYCSSETKVILEQF